MKIAVVGADGQLGRDVVQAFMSSGDNVHGLSHSDLEVSDINSVSKCLLELRPHVIVNTAAMHNVELCERQPLRTFAVNALGARNVAILADRIGAKLIHVSTDYVFDGAKGSPYDEEDTPRPLNTYGNTKLAGECFVRSTAERHFVLRTSAIYGRSPCRGKDGLNFVQLMLKLAKERSEVRVVNDEFVTPTPTSELAHQIVMLSRCDSYGLYHATSEGSCSWYEFAREIFMLTNTQICLSPANPNEFPAKVSRPRYSVLENHGLKARGMNVFRPWQEGLRTYLNES